MSVHTEWLLANPLYVTIYGPGIYVDADGNTTENLGLVLSNGDDVIIDGTADSLRALAQRILTLVDIAEMND